MIHQLLTKYDYDLDESTLVISHPPDSDLQMDGCEAHVPL